MKIGDLRINQEVVVVNWSSYNDMPSISQGTVTQIGSEPDRFAPSPPLQVHVRINNRVKQFDPEQVFQSGAEAAEFVCQLARQKIHKLEDIIKNPLAQMKQ